MFVQSLSSCEDKLCPFACVLLSPHSFLLNLFFAIQPAWSNTAWRNHTYLENCNQVVWLYAVLLWMTSLATYWSSGTNTILSTCQMLIYHARCWRKSSMSILLLHCHMQCWWSSWKLWRIPYHESTAFEACSGIWLILLLCFVVNALSQMSLPRTENIKRRSFSVLTAISLQVIIQCRLRSAVILVSNVIIFCRT